MAPKNPENRDVSDLTSEEYAARLRGGDLPNQEKPQGGAEISQEVIPVDIQDEREEKRQRARERARLQVPSVGLQKAREKMIRKRMEEGVELTGPQQKFYDEHMKDNESVLDGPVATGEGETMVNSASETRTDLGKEEKPGAKGFMELPEEERRRRYKEMKETEEKEKQEAMAAARAKVEALYGEKTSQEEPFGESPAKVITKGDAWGATGNAGEVMGWYKTREEAEQQVEWAKNIWKLVHKRPHDVLAKAEASYEGKEKKLEKDAEKPAKPEALGQPEQKETGMSPEDTIKYFFNSKREIEKKLSETEDKFKKEALLTKKRALAKSIIKTAVKLPQFKDIEFEIQREQEKQWEQGIAASGYKSTENYNKWIENIYYDEIINSSNLSKKQKEEISEHRSIIVSNWPKTIELEKGDVAVALKMGIDINTIKGPKWWNPFSKKIQVGDKVFDNIDKFNEYIAQGRAHELVDSDIIDRVRAAKWQIMEKSSDPIIDDKIQKLMKSLFGPKESPKQEKSAEDRLGLLGKLRGDWNKANEIHTALKDKNWKIKMPDGKLIIGSEAKAQMEQRLGELSEDIIKVAGQIEGRNLKKEAIKATGYKLDKDPQKQKEYRQWLTDEVRKIFDREKGGIEEATGKKVVARSRKKAENKAKTAAVPVSEPEPVKPESTSEPIRAEAPSQPEVTKTREVESEALPGYEPGQKVDIVFPDPKNEGYYISDKGSVFKGVREEGGEKIVMLEKDGKPYSMLLDLFLETQKQKTLAQNPDELTKDLPDFPGLAKRAEKPKSKVKKSQAPEEQQQFPEGFRKGIKKGAKLKPIIKRDIE